jgi:hypothetical protein
VIDEVKRAGFVLAADYDFVKPDGADYFLIFGPSLTATEQHVMSSNPKDLSHERIHGRQERPPGKIPGDSTAKRTDRS